MSFGILPEYTSDARNGRRFPSLCRVSSELVAIIGGSIQETQYLQSCLLYNLANESVSALPHLNQKRRTSSSCFLDNKLYTFCGRSEHGYLNTIEMLAMDPSSGHQGNNNWRLLQGVYPSVLKARANCIACPINASEIVIMGGYN